MTSVPTRPVTQDAELTASYLQDARSVIAGLEDATVDLWVPDQRSRALDSLWVLSHRLHGTAGLYGHPQTAALAALLERLMEGRAGLNSDSAVPILTAILERAMTCVSSALNRIEQDQSEGDVGLMFASLDGPAQVTELLRTQPFELEARQAHSEEQGEPPFAVVNAAIWEDFGPEAAELTAALRIGLHADIPDLTALFRAAHTLKGSSAMVGLAELAEVGHAMEDLLGAAREDAVTLDRAMPLIDDGLSLVDTVLAHAEGQVREAPHARIQAYRAAVAALLSGQDPATLVAATPDVPVPAPETRLSVRVDSSRLDGMLDDVAGLVAARARLNGLFLRQQQVAASLDAAHERVQRTVRDFEERYLNPNLTPGGAPAGTPLDRQPDRRAPTDLGLQDRLADFGALELDTYDDLNILARAVTELSADLVEIRAQTAQVISTLGDELTGLEKLTRQLRVELSRARLVPLERVTAPLHRWAKRRTDLTLRIHGEDSLIDAQYAAPLGQSLLHLLTNAAVHGAQDPAERAAQGKGTLLQVTVDATVADGHLRVTVRDDGRGLNFDALRQRALQSGHLSAGELGKMTDEQTAQLVFLPGLSTAGQVTQEAGRGVGMDAVRDAVARLGGRVTLTSRPGQGTAITLHLPVAQQIADVLVMRVGSQRVAVLATQMQGMSVLDGEAPEGSVDLSVLWGEERAGQRYVARLALPVTEDEGTLNVLVDEFLSLEEVVLRPAGTLLGGLEYLSGMTTLNDEHGHAYPVAVLNPSGLRRTRAAARRTQLNAAPSAAHILLVDDSLSVRRHVGRSLERFGFTVSTASDGQEALERLLAGERADLLLSDLEMPRMNGFELLRAVRSSPAHATLPVVIMTTRAGEKHQQLALELGANDYLAKPAEERLLQRRLGALLPGAEGRA
ncbi:response regulator [Deinococcus taeanensis]|uniref:hybrid sensor histidine kinase/response regulator n=1 Tax=Deinococcus taeanensis TaxID=2737050 RepID=UPI001CDCFD21|nr:hybrid sensor histidine kinase/response regulator [Deinococcus taeanensis]UBV42078.1 response regulator [Deinococcus taeanensis]